MDELPLAVAQRRVAEAEAEARVTAQALLVADAARWGLDTAQVKATLAVFETTLRFMREDLIREQERATGDQQ